MIIKSPFCAIARSVPRLVPLTKTKAIEHRETQMILYRDKKHFKDCLIRVAILKLSQPPLC